MRTLAVKYLLRRTFCHIVQFYAIYCSDMDRAELLGLYIADKNATVRETAQAFGISKSTVHKDVTVHLKSINSVLYERVQNVLSLNLSVRHIRGGEATKRKWKTN